ncbi:MAG: GrpB family protein [Pseudomonadota bacterium]
MMADRPKAWPVPHDPAWAGRFVAAKHELQEALGEVALAIHHVGSTAIPGIYAKPVIDVLIEATSLDALDQRASAMRARDYVPRGEKGISGRRYYPKDDREGVRTHHVHAFAKGSPHIERHLAFRDYLLAHRDVAARYCELKRNILKDWRGLQDYIARKASFVVETEARALAWARAQDR